MARSWWSSRLSEFGDGGSGVPPEVNSRMWGYPPTSRYIKIMELARIIRKVFKNNDLHGKSSGIRT